MALTTNTGLPGLGKTELLTYFSIKHYKRTNSLLNRYIRRKKGLSEYINNVYSDYPILLDIKHNVYSRVIDIDDLDNTWKLLPDSFVAIDEPQLDYDSLDTKEFPRAIAMFLQAHRHFDISCIAFATQHPNRLIVYEKNIMNEYTYIKNAICIPFTPFKFLIMRKVYELVDYDSINTRDKEEMRKKNIEKKYRIFNYKKVHKCYDSKYLHVLNSFKPYLDKGFYTSLELTPGQVKKYLDKYKKYSVKKRDEDLAASHRLQPKSSGNFSNFLSKKNS